MSSRKLHGQSISLHGCVSEAIDPSIVQLSPPFSGMGLSHERPLDCVPLPHVAEHSDQSAQSPQPPLMGPSAR